MGSTTKDTSRTKRSPHDDDETPYARYAFWNPYNLSLFIGGAVVGVATGHEWITVLTCAAEVLWMIYAPDSKLLRALWFDRAFVAAKKAADVERRKERIGLLSPNDGLRLASLCGQKQVIEHVDRLLDTSTFAAFPSRYAAARAEMARFLEANGLEHRLAREEA